MNKITNRRYVTLGIFVVTLLAAIEGTIVSTAIPTIVSELGGIRLISWVVSIYLLTSAVTTPIYGKLADLYGRKKIFFIGIVIFLIGAMLAGAAQTMEQLIAFRAFQGIGAGAILTLTFTIVGDMYSFEESGKIQGMISGVWGIAGVLGPMTGGFLVDYVSWRWIFYMNIPFGIIALILIGIFLHENVNIKKKKPHIDYGGALTFTASMTLLMYALLSGGSTYAWGSIEMIALLSLSVILFVIFFVIEKRSIEPMLPLQLFRNRMLVIAFLSGFVISVLLAGITFYTPIWVQGIQGTGATGAGLALIPLSVTWPIGALAGGKLIMKIGTRATSLLGAFFIVAGTLWLANMHEDSPIQSLYVIMGIEGIGFGLAFTVFTLKIQAAVDWNLRGAANGSNNFIKGLGQTIGIAILGAVFNASLAGFFSNHPDMDMNKMLGHAGSVSIPEHLLQLSRTALADGLQVNFIILSCVTVLVILIPLWLPSKHKELSSQKQ